MQGGPSFAGSRVRSAHSATVPSGSEVNDRSTTLVTTALRTAVTAVLVLAGCAPTAKLSELRRQGMSVQERGGGWYVYRAPEGYRFSMPGVPLMESQMFTFMGTPVPERFFDLSAELNTRGFLVRVFDARQLPPEQQELLRDDAIDLFLSLNMEVQERRTVVEAGRDVEHIAADYGFHHIAMIRSFIRDGFVIQMLAIIQRGMGTPHDAHTFFRSAM